MRRLGLFLAVLTLLLGCIYIHGCTRPLRSSTSPTALDADHDNIPDDVDLCPALAEDLDHFEHLGRVISVDRLLALSAGTTPAAEWAAVPRPPWKDRSVHLRFFQVKGKKIQRWNGSTDEPVN